MSLSVLSKEVLKHQHVSLARKAYHIYYLFLRCCVCFAASTNPPHPHFPRCYLRLYKIKSCMQSCSESHQCQVDRRHKERLRIQILKAGEKEQAVLAGGDKTKHSVVSETQRGEICHRKSLWLGLSPSKIQELIQRSLQWQGVTT